MRPQKPFIARGRELSSPTLKGRGFPAKIYKIIQSGAIEKATAAVCASDPIWWNCIDRLQIEATIERLSAHRRIEILHAKQPKRSRITSAGPGS
jgi:hypothetical protein